MPIIAEALVLSTFSSRRFRRIWTMYLSGTTETFPAGLDLHHIVFVKGRDTSVYPATRDFLYDGFSTPADGEVECYE